MSLEKSGLKLSEIKQLQTYIRWVEQSGDYTRRKDLFNKRHLVIKAWVEQLYNKAKTRWRWSKSIEVGDYVFAARWSDTRPQKETGPWAVGFVSEERLGAFTIVDEHGRMIGGRLKYRYVKKISKENGARILK